MVQKSRAVEALGGERLMTPTRVRAALRANDRLKLCFTALQAACAHADAPERPPVDLSRERSTAGLSDRWLDTLTMTAARSHDVYLLPRLDALIATLRADLATMARPLVDTGTDAAPADHGLAERVAELDRWLGTLPNDRLTDVQVARIVAADRVGGDATVHRAVMDMHRALNRLAAQIAPEEVEGAHAWNLAEADRPLVAAFMRGLHATAWCKFDHPGLDTAATRDGERLMIQNDIGTNDAHVLVLTVEGQRIALTYSDLHAERHAFFRKQLSDQGATWTVVAPRTDATLNAGQAFVVGTATWACTDGHQVEAALEAIGSRIVFLIDWNRARKRIKRLAGKSVALRVLERAAQAGTGHMAWLRSGGDRLVFDAMQSAGSGAFRIGDRLDDVLDTGTVTFLTDVLALCARSVRAGVPPAQTADEVRLLLQRALHQRDRGFDALSEHAGYCRELAAAVRDVLAGAGDDLAELAGRCKGWERRADEVVAQAGEAARRNQHRREAADLLRRADDIADSLEEATFTAQLLAESRGGLPTGATRASLLAMAQTVLDATTDYVRALVIAPTLRDDTATEDATGFLDATWRVILAEQRADEQLRAARRAIVRHPGEPADLLLATDLAQYIEAASDHLMATTFALRDLVLDPGRGRTA